MLAFRDANHFLAGQLHNFHDAWLSIASQANCNTAGEVLSWIEDGVNVFRYFQLFGGSFKGENFDCDLPPYKIFHNPIYYVDRFPPIFLVLFQSVWPQVPSPSGVG